MPVMILSLHTHSLSLYEIVIWGCIRKTQNSTKMGTNKRLFLTFVTYKTLIGNYFSESCLINFKFQLAVLTVMMGILVYLAHLRVGKFKLLKFWALDTSNSNWSSKDIPKWYDLIIFCLILVERQWYKYHELTWLPRWKQNFILILVEIIVLIF